MFQGLVWVLVYFFPPLSGKIKLCEEEENGEDRGFTNNRGAVIKCSDGDTLVPRQIQDLLFFH